MNRVLITRLESSPKCGKCKEPLFTGESIELNAANYDAVVNRSGLPAVVDFWASWCRPCKMMVPVFAQIVGALEPRMHFAKLDIEI